jgi:hypothetical protein
MPERISSPSLTVFGTLSPVRADVSTFEVPWIMIPSTGTLSPGLIRIMSPTLSFSGFI